MKTLHEYKRTNVARVVRGPQLALPGTVNRKPTGSQPEAARKVTAAEVREREARRKKREKLERGATYRQQFIKCGKPRCRVCRGGAAHGPYWYVERRDESGKKVSTRYVGRSLSPAVLAYVIEHGEPAAAAAAAEQLSRNGDGK